jgi:integrase
MHHQITNSEFYLPPSDIAQLIAHAGSKRNRLLISILAYTGMRRAEVRCLHREDIDNDAHRIYIRNGKGGKARIVFYPHHLDELFSACLPQIPRGPLFPGTRGSYLTLRTINNIVAAAGHRAGIDNPNPRYRNVNPHLLRHSVARNWKNQNGSMESLQKILGHASMRTTYDLYGTQSIDDVQDNYEKMAKNLVEATPTDGEPDG